MKTLTRSKSFALGELNEPLQALSKETGLSTAAIVRLALKQLFDRLKQGGKLV